MLRWVTHRNVVDIAVLSTMTTWMLPEHNRVATIRVCSMLLDQDGLPNGHVVRVEKPTIQVAEPEDMLRTSKPRNVFKFTRVWQRQCFRIPPRRCQQPSHTLQSYRHRKPRHQTLHRPLSLLPNHPPNPQCQHPMQILMTCWSTWPLWTPPFEHALNDIILNVRFQIRHHHLLRSRLI